MASKVSSIKRGSKPVPDLPATNIEIPLKIILDSIPALNELSVQPLAGKTAFRLGKVLRTINQEVDDYEKARKGICEKYGKLAEDESYYDIEEESKEVFKNETEELLATSVTLTLTPFKITDLENASISGVAMMTLDWLIVE